MNRRDFLQVSAAATIGGIVGSEIEAAKPEVRCVMFNPLSEKICAIYWMSGHRPIDEFVAMYREHVPACAAMQPEQVKHGWASQKMNLGGVYVSDSPQPNFEPITYWISADVPKEESV